MLETKKVKTKNKKPKLLLHICCAGCGAYLARELQNEFEVVLYFYNPNIFSWEEFEKRLSDVKKIGEQFGIDLIVGDYDHLTWLDKVRGLEKEPERGRRCLVCYTDRMQSSAKLAHDNDFDFFATSLTMSPHKSAEAISAIGNDLAREYGIKFLDRDFKKNDGYRKSIALSRDLNLYRQNYCGCEFS